MKRIPVAYNEKAEQEHIVFQEIVRVIKEDVPEGMSKDEFLRICEVAFVQYLFGNV